MAYSLNWPNSQIPRSEPIRQNTSQFFYDIEHPLPTMIAAPTEIGSGIPKTLTSLDGTEILDLTQMSDNNHPFQWIGSRAVIVPPSFMNFDRVTNNRWSFLIAYAGYRVQGYAVLYHEVIHFYHSPSIGVSVCTFDDEEPTLAQSNVINREDAIHVPVRVSFDATSGTDTCIRPNYNIGNTQLRMNLVKDDTNMVKFQVGVDTLSVIKLGTFSGLSSESNTLMFPNVLYADAWLSVAAGLNSNQAGYGKVGGYPDFSGIFVSR